MSIRDLLCKCSLCERKGQFIADGVGLSRQAVSRFLKNQESGSSGDGIQIKILKLLFSLGFYTEVMVYLGWLKDGATNSLFIASILYPDLSPNELGAIRGLESQLGKNLDSKDITRLINRMRG